MFNDRPSGEEAWLHDTRSEFVTGAWARTVLQPAAMALMSLALFVGCISVLDLLVPGPWFSFSFFCFLTALEAVYTTLWLHHPDRRIVDRVRYRAAELVVLALLTRLLVWAVGGSGFPSLDEWRLFLRLPQQLFADGVFLTLLILLIAVWGQSIRFATLFAYLAVSESEARYYSQPRHVQERWSDDKPIMLQRQALLTAFFKQWLWGGIFLVVCVGLSSLELGEMAGVINPLAVTRLGLRPALLAGLISYFLAGFWLLSQGRLEMMNARWLINGVRKQESVDQRWQRGSLLLLLGIALLAAFLPIGSTLPIGRILDMVVGLFLYVANLLFYLLILFFNFLLAAMAGEGEVAERPTEPPPTFDEILAQQRDSASPPPNETATLVVSSLFWAVMLFVAVSAILFFLRERGVSLNRGTLGRGWRLLLAWLQMLWRGVETQAAELRRTLRVQRAGREEVVEQTAVSPWRFVRVSALSPREQIRYFYLSVVRRARDRGVQRSPGETPLEYIQDLSTEWPEQSDEFTQLTDAFLEARYAARPIQKSRADAVRDTWKQVRTSIRGRRHARDGEPPEPGEDDAA